MSEIDLEEGYDRGFFWASSLCAEPICEAFEKIRFRLVAPFGKFDTFENNSIEIAYRVSLAASAIFLTITGILPLGAIVCGVFSKVFKAVGLAFQKDNYTYMRGSAPEKHLNGSIKLFTWNVGGIGGGMAYDHCGITPWKHRVDGLVQKILSVDADVVVLQEIYDTALLEALVKKLGPHYSHFFTHLGPSFMGSVGGGMVISRCHTHNIQNESFHNNDWTLNRTFTTLEVSEAPNQKPALRIIGTHLIHDNNSNRMEQLKQIRGKLEMSAPLPTVIMGDLNLEKNKPEEGGVLDTFLTHSYDGKQPTATNELVWQWNPEKWGTPGETIDYISQFKDGPQGRFTDTRLVEAFDKTFNTRTALSDHNGIETVYHYR